MTDAPAKLPTIVQAACVPDEALEAISFFSAAIGDKYAARGANSVAWAGGTEFFVHLAWANECLSATLAPESPDEQKVTYTLMGYCHAMKIRFDLYH